MLVGVSLGADVALGVAVALGVVTCVVVTAAIGIGDGWGAPPPRENA
jgi:hypothetical protein